MSAQSDLDAVAAAYQAWRGTSPKRGQSPDPKLQKRIVALLRRHGWDEVCRRVGVSRYHLSKWRRAYGTPTKRRSRTKKTATEVPSFVEVAPAITAMAELEVHAPNGVVVKARGAQNVDALLGLATAWARGDGP